MNHTQHNRPFQVLTPLPFDTLLFYRMSGEEDLARLFRYELDLLSEAPSIDPNALLGRPMCVRVEGYDGDPNDPARWFHGIVQRFSLVGFHGSLAHYQAELRPWLWFLTRTADCRIFQDQSIPDIVKAIFREHGFTDFEDLTTQGYRPRDYCVQYRETDFHFINRLLEHEGIYYYFVHDKDKHQLSSSRIRRAPIPPAPTRARSRTKPAAPPEPRRFMISSPPGAATRRSAPVASPIPASTSPNRGPI